MLCSSQRTENLPERPPGSLFGDNPSGWAFGRTGQIHMGRANSFRAIVAGLTADEFQLPREAVDERRCRDEIGLGTLAEAAAAYRTDPECPGRRRRRSLEGRLHHRRPPSRAPSSCTAGSRSPSGSPSSGPCATTSPSSARPSCAASPTRPPSSGGTACSPRYPATRTGSCRATPSGSTRPTSTTPTSQRATSGPASAACPARSPATALPSTSTGTRSRSPATTGGQARRA